MRKPVFAFIAFSAWWHTVLSVRSHTDAEPCPIARQQSEDTYEISSQKFKGDSLLQGWLLYQRPDCGGDAAGKAVVVPRVDVSEPVQMSNISIWVHTESSQTLYLCRRDAQQCVAQIRPPKVSWRFVDVFKGVVDPAVLRAFHTLDREVALIFEILILLTILIFFLALLWLVAMVREARNRPRWGLSEDVSDKRLQLPETSDIMFQGFLDVLFFVIGCCLFVIQGERFFRTYHDSGLGLVLVLAFPLLFGCLGVLRIFMATYRCHLYYESLRSGMLLQFQSVSFLQDPLLLWFWLGIVITIGKALHVLCLKRNGTLGDVEELAVFVSPLYYMISSVMDIQSAEKTALSQCCILSLQGRSEDPLRLGKDAILAVPEATFVTLARERKDLLQGAREADECSGELNAFDLRWVGAVSQRPRGLNRLPLHFFNPALFCVLLCLALLSCTVCFRTITFRPRLEHVTALGGRLSEEFSPERMDYGVMVHTAQHLLAITATADPTETSGLKLTSQGLNQSGVAKVTTPISLDQEIYPLDVQIQVQDRRITEI